VTRGGQVTRHRLLAKKVDQGSSALVLDLKRHGLLDDRLVVWNGELSCAVRRQNLGGDYGRDHHRCCFCVGLAGGGMKNTLTYGEIDDRGYNIVDQDTCGVRVYDLNATVLHLSGIDHPRMTCKFQERDYRLTDVPGPVVSNIWVT